MRIQQRSSTEALASLQSGPGGLTQVEAARRLNEYGLNAAAMLGLEEWRKGVARHRARRSTDRSEHEGKNVEDGAR